MGFFGSKIAIQVELQLLGEFYGLSMFILDRYDNIVGFIKQCGQSSRKTVYLQCKQKLQ